MRLRMTLVLDLDVPDLTVMEKVGTTDPSSAAAAYQAYAQTKINDDKPDEITLAQVTVIPVYG